MASSNDSKTILSILVDHVNERPDHQLFHWADGKANITDSLSYRELWDKSCAVAYLLEANDVKIGDRVMIAYPFGLDFLAGLVGCMMVGVIGCSVYPPNPKQLNIDLPPFNLKAEDAGAKFALTTVMFRRFISLNSFIGNKSVVTWLATDRLRTPSSDWSPRVSVNDVSPDDVAFIQYTSGSTGFPKGVMISQRSLVYNSRLCAETCGAFKDSDPNELARFTGVSWLPQYHDLGLIGCFFMTLYAGTVVVVFSPLDFILNPILWHDLVIKYKPETTMGPNSFGLLVKRLQGRKQPFEKWTFVKNILCGAEPVDPDVMDQVMKVLGLHPSSLLVGYGLAEVGLQVGSSQYFVRDGLVACADLDRNREAKICVVNEANQKVEDGAVGEVFVQSPSQVALGYWGNPEATRKTFWRTVANTEGAWLATGDLGKVIENKMYITGRMKEVIILNGRNFFPVDIERVVEKAYPLIIRPGCVVAYQHSNEGVGLVADLRKGVKPDDHPKPFEVVNLISKECQVPTEYVCLLKTHSIPKTTSGKIMRVKVKETSIAGTWSKSMVELNWRKPQKTSATPLRKARRASALEHRFSLTGVASNSEFITAEMFDKASRRSLIIRDETAQLLSSFSERGVDDRRSMVVPREDNPPLGILGGEDKNLREEDSFLMTDTNLQQCPFAQGTTCTSPTVDQASQDVLRSGNSPSTKPAGGVYGLEGMYAFYEKHGTGPYVHGDTVESATLGYQHIVEELGMMEDRLDSGDIKRHYDIAENIMADTRLWREVPSFPAKEFTLAQDAVVHKAYLPWLRTIFARLPRAGALRGDIRNFISSKTQSLCEEDMKEWANLALWKWLAAKSLSPAEANRFKELQSRSVTLGQGQRTPSDDLALAEKSMYLRELMDRLQIDEDKASTLVDVLTFSSLDFCRVANICVAVLFGGGKLFNLKETHLDESNVKQFVWECLRMFPPLSAVGWRDGSKICERHVAVIGMTGRDKSLWGEDVESFRMERCTAEEFSAKSCFFSEQSGAYACKGKTFALEAISALLLELVDSGPWMHRGEIHRYPIMPFFNVFHLRRLPRVVVVGGGIAGLVCALRLSQRGIKVTLVEKHDDLGGHARHSKVLGGHQRNPAFGVFLASIYPNFMGLIDALGLEKVAVCSAGRFRQNLAFDGHQIPNPDLKEVDRFLAQMASMYRSSTFGESQTIGDFLAGNGYDHEFVCRFIVGKLVHYFPGLTVQQYLEIPIELFTWFVVSDMNIDQLEPVFRLRNKDYMDIFASTLSMHDVEIITGVTPKLLSRSDDGVSVEIDSRVVSADKIVLAMPPNAAAVFLGEHTLPTEVGLRMFDCPLETVVLHQDPKWSPKDETGGICGIVPNVGKPLPSKDDTVPMTIAFVSDTDFKTPIFSTHAYANYSDLDIDGPKEYFAFTHVRITRDTVKLRNTLLASQGKSSTYFAGGWLRGFMLHEDALVTGTEVANEILKGCDLEPHAILSRKIGLQSKPSTTKVETHSQSPSVDPRNEHESVLKLIEHALGREVHASDRLQDLGLTSLTISSLHASLLENFQLTNNELPVSVFFEGEKLVGDIVAGVFSSTPSNQPSTNKMGLTVETVNEPDHVFDTTEEIISLISCKVGSPVGPENQLEELGMTSLVVSSLHAALQEKYGLSEEDLPVSVLLEGTTSIHDLVSRVRSCHRARIRERRTHNVSTDDSATNEKPRRPHEQPWVDNCAAIVGQLIAVATQATFLGCTIYVPVLCSLVLVETGGGWILLMLSPLLVHVHAITSGLLLVVVKWILLGRLKEGHTALWSSKFAARWIVRQCSRLLWNYSLWGLCGDMEILNILHRLLGCTIGDNVSIEPGCVTDYDLVKIGSSTSIAERATIITSTVSLGVQSLNPVVIGTGCTIKFGCLVERGAVVADGVVMEPTTLVTAFSKLDGQSAWHGKPAEPIETTTDVETGLGSNRDQLLSSVVAHSSRGSRLTYLEVVRFLTVFALTPCLWLIEFGTAILVGSAIYAKLGYLGLVGLVWVPPTTVFTLLFAFSIAMKRLLLGKVKPAIWPRGGSFHARKYFVDHLIKEHAVRWKVFSSNAGSFLAGSVVVEQQLLRWLGVKVGTSASVWTDCWTTYDLLEIGSRVIVGGGGSFNPWKTTSDSFIGDVISISDGCFIGAGTAVMPGVEVAKGSTVASFSLVTKNVEVGRTVIGTREYQTTIVESEGEGTDIAIPETGKQIGLFGVWIGISVLVYLGLLFIEEGTKVTTVDETTVFVRALTLSFTISGVFLLILPSYFLVMMWAGKTIILGRVTPIALSTKSKKVIPRFAFGPAFLEQMVPYTIQAFGGTFVETFMWASLGANIGYKVYLDGIGMFEPDLVTIGDWSTVTESILTTHHLAQQTNKYSPLTIGNRCTISNGCNLQLASLEDDTEMAALTMPLTGSRLKSGTWAGYPARRIGDAIQPPRPRRSAWITLLFNPYSTVLGCLWLLTLPLQTCFSVLRNKLQGTGERDLESASSCVSIPDMFKGTFWNSEKSLKLNFDAADWIAEVRILRIPTGSCLSSDEEGEKDDHHISWWRTMASYEFDLSNDREYVGRVSLGWWNIPLSIVTAKIRVVDDRDLSWSHSWFTGEPEDEMSFRKSNDPTVLDGRRKKQL